MNKRKIIGLLAATTLIFGGAGIAKAESAHQVSSNTTQVQDVNLLANTNVSGYACVINGNGNLVLYSNTQAKGISGYVSVGEMLHILGQQGNLIKVQVEETGAVGYINKANVYNIIDASANNVVRMNRNAQVINVSSVVNVRTAPSMGAKVETTLTNGTQVRVTGKAGDWFRVSVNGVKGYIFGEYLECGNFTTSNVTANSTSSSSTGSTSNISGTIQNSGTSSSSSISGTTQNNGKSSTSNVNGTTKIQSLQKQLSEQKSKLKDLNNKLDNMKNQLQKDKASVSKIESEIPQIKNDIKNVENKIKDIEGQIKNEQQKPADKTTPAEKHEDKTTPVVKPADKTTPAEKHENKTTPVVKPADKTTPAEKHEDKTAPAENHQDKKADQSQSVANNTSATSTSQDNTTASTTSNK